MNAMEICVLRTENVLSTQEIIPTTVNVKRDILESIVRIWVGKPYSIFYLGMRFLPVSRDLVEKIQQLLFRHLIKHVEAD